ncbi:MAG TPA: HPr family phosphocarrier protein [Anaerolineae bacterium]|nr:HPr family phosphocarrier protein [Anaerolineae bacterium]
MCKAELIIHAKVGLHARPAASFVKTANSFKSTINARNLTARRGPANAKSILSLLTLGVEQNHAVEVMAEGVDEAEAVAALCRLVESNFGEME